MGTNPEICPIWHIEWQLGSRYKKSPEMDDSYYFNGADDGTRTHNNLLGRQEL